VSLGSFRSSCHDEIMMEGERRYDRGGVDLVGEPVAELLNLARIRENQNFGVRRLRCI